MGPPVQSYQSDIRPFLSLLRLNHSASARGKGSAFRDLITTAQSSRDVFNCLRRCFVPSSFSLASLKSIACLVAIPFLIYGAVQFHPEGLAQVVFWLTGAACLFGCFFFLNTVLHEHEEGWLVLVPGSVVLSATTFVTYVAIIFSGVQQIAALTIAIIILGLGFTLWYNIKRLGAFDGLIVTIIESCFAIIVMGLVFLFQASSSNSKKYRD